MSRRTSRRAVSGWEAGSGRRSATIYVLTGNGKFDANILHPNNDYGDSLLRLTSTLKVADYFTPMDQALDYAIDNDFGSGGAAILADLPANSPLTHLVMGGGKDGSLYAWNRDLLGGLGDTNAVQQISFGYGLMPQERTGRIIFIL